MPDLLLELLTEEIPARMQMQAMEDLRHIAFQKLRASGFETSGIRSFVTPRRLTLVVEGLPSKQPDVVEERRGPRVDAPQSAIEGFLKSAGLASIDQCERRDTGKGVFYFAIIKRAGAPTGFVLLDVLKTLILELTWSKSMRFPAASFRWVRPLISVLCLFDDAIIKIPLDHVPVAGTTRGHRFLAPEPFAVKDFADYEAMLRKAHVILEPAERRGLIADGVAKTAKAAGLSVKDDRTLLDEVTGLVEWPVVLMGTIDPKFMELPPEVLTTSMRTHQKYFACLDAAGKLAPKFLVVANMVARDGGKAIVAGNERVLRARLSDAQFFWEQDRKVPLSSRMPRLAERTFFQGLGSIADKIERMQRLASELAVVLLRDPRWLSRPWPVKITQPGESFMDALQRIVSLVISLAKADLTTGMVGEFPELQGIMGRHYALHEGVPDEIASAIEDHYSPQGPNDSLPGSPYGVIASLADKFDSLVGFWLIGEKPTGSKDPFGLRRAALGVIRLIVEFRLRLNLLQLIERSEQLYLDSKYPAIFGQWQKLQIEYPAFQESVAQDLLAFFADRLKVHLREKGVRHDLITAVFTLGGEDDLVRLLARVDALRKFLDSADGANLLVAYRRASNIVRIEGKKDGVTYRESVNPKLLQMTEERALAARLEAASAKAAEALKREAFDAAMAALATLRAPVDEFFARVTVNIDDGQLRENRLRLLARVRDTLNQVADFSRIEG